MRLFESSRLHGCTSGSAESNAAGTDKIHDVEALGPVLFLLSIPLVLRWVPRNYVFGFRIAATLRSDSVWYDANARFGRHALLLGLSMIALEFMLPLSIRNFTLGAVALVGLAAILVADWRTANRWDRERSAARDHTM